MKLLYDKQGASEMLSISTSTLDRLVANGQIAQTRLGGRVMFKHTDLQAFVEKLGFEDNPDSTCTKNEIVQLQKRPGRHRLSV